MSVPELSVVVLCYRAGDKVHGIVKDLVPILESCTPSYELVLVGNYDSDADTTPHAVAQAAGTNERITYLALKKEGMMGWDVRTGLAAARGAYLGFVDGDGQVPFHDIQRVFSEMKRTGADLGKTYRVTRDDDAWRAIVSYIFNLLFHLLFPGLHSRDMNAKPKLFTRAAYQTLTLTANDWFIDAEIMIQARRNRFSIVELPTTFRKLEGRRSFVRFGTLFEFTWNLARARLHEHLQSLHNAK